MAEAFTSYIVDNDRKFRNALEKVSFDIKDLTIPLTLISMDFFRSEEAIFSLKGPGKYPEISRKYGMLKQKKVGFQYPLLVRTGRLAESMTDPNSPDTINEIVNKDTLRIGTRVEYGIYHQSDRQRSKIPLRKFLFIGPEAPQFASGPTAGRMERWLGILNGFYAEKMKALGKVKNHNG